MRNAGCLPLLGEITSAGAGAGEFVLGYTYRERSFCPPQLAQVPQTVLLLRYGKFSSINVFSF